MQRAPDAECSEELISAIVHMCHVVGGPASGITRVEAIAAATFKDELHTYKWVGSSSAVHLQLAAAPTQLHAGGRQTQPLQPCLSLFEHPVCGCLQSCEVGT